MDVIIKLGEILTMYITLPYIALMLFILHADNIRKNNTGDK